MRGVCAKVSGRWWIEVLAGGLLFTGVGCDREETAEAPRAVNLSEAAAPAKVAPPTPAALPVAETPFPAPWPVVPSSAARAEDRVATGMSSFPTASPEDNPPARAGAITAPPPHPEQFAPPSSATQSCSAYRAATDANERSRVLAALDELEPAERVRVVAALLPTEKNPELLVQMLDTLQAVEGQDAGKLPLVLAAARADRPLAVRVAAADVLETVTAPDARAAWSAFAADAAPDLRERARAALDRLPL